MKHTILILSLLTFLCSCNTKEDKSQMFSRMNRFEDKNIVVTAVARKGIFYREFESNGKLESARRSSLSYELDEQIESVDVKNGQRISKGQVISTLDDTRQRHAYEKICRNLDKARLSLEDALINMGYQLKDSLSIPPNILKVAMIRSGYQDAFGEKKMAVIQLAKTKICAPFGGVVADLKAKPYNKSGQYKALCTLIDDKEFEVAFPVLENEAFQLKPGMNVAIIPYAFDRDTITGVLAEVNPKVDKTGMVLAKATIRNSTGKLSDGMNVKVIVRDALPNKLIIPKSAVTFRQERKVVFVCKNDTAIWRYVNVEAENSRYCVIRGNKIKPGEEVITDGNFNLAHMVPVVKME